VYIYIIYICTHIYILWPRSSVVVKALATSRGSRIRGPMMSVIFMISLNFSVYTRPWGLFRL
jgi:hypothetical protein